MMFSSIKCFFRDMISSKDHIVLINLKRLVKLALQLDVNKTYLISFKCQDSEITLVINTYLDTIYVYITNNHLRMILYDFDHAIILNHIRMMLCKCKLGTSGCCLEIVFPHLSAPALALVQEKLCQTKLPKFLGSYVRVKGMRTHMLSVDS